MQRLTQRLFHGCLNLHLQKLKPLLVPAARVRALAGYLSMIYSERHLLKYQPKQGSFRAGH